MIRCIYRIPEMAGGWGNFLMKHELSFLILDGAMVLIAIALLTIFRPAMYFPQLTAKGKRDGLDCMPLPLVDQNS
ncbi:hypothetical protein EDB81DRAFT_875082 [Dactylonectria macrodidyma]|uniref:Uncharacterized protein n=1 Tax=Dactylonectria macrodidyma TaxID=307937 RepID=A0A9P9JIU5_9HYPO|nr:hypothetical protein EDB81DRAFT_875082 [Dactylonectria macrodidyma]